MPLPKSTLRGLHAFLAVYEEQSFSRAAIRENATQSGMSTQVKTLEKALGATLLNRGKGALSLTPEGAIVYARGQQILRDLFDIEERLSRLGKGVSGTIRLGIIPALTRAVLPRALGAYRRDHPDVEITVMEEYSYSLMRRVLEGDLDCAAVPSGDILPGLSAKWLSSDHEVLVAPPGFRPDRPHLSPVRPADLSGLRLVLPASINVRRRALDQYFTSHGVALADIMEMDAMLGTLELIGAGDWCAILPAAICYPDIKGGNRKLHPLTAPDMHLDYVMVQKAERTLGEAGTLLIEALGAAATSLAADWDRVAGQAG